LALAGWNLHQDVIQSCPTWMKWPFDSGSPQTLSKVSGQICADIAESGSFFARKFPVGSDIADYNLHLGSRRFLERKASLVRLLQS
jgi:hypothetical protein